MKNWSTIETTNNTKKKIFTNDFVMFCNPNGDNENSIREGSLPMKIWSKKFDVNV
jgi:hypothetical protein